MSDTTFRLGILGAESYGQTAITPELAKFVLPPDYDATKHRLVMERTDWEEQHGRLRIKRTVLIDAETTPGEWRLPSMAA